MFSLWPRQQAAGQRARGSSPLSRPQSRKLGAVRVPDSVRKRKSQICKEKKRGWEDWTVFELSLSRRRDLVAQLPKEAWPTYAAARRRWLGGLDAIRAAALAAA